VTHAAAGEYRAFDGRYEDRDLGNGDVPASAALVRYRRRVDAAKVLEVVAAPRAMT
jgi:hypothetical protein